MTRLTSLLFSSFVLLALAGSACGGGGDATSGFAVCVCDFTGETDGGVACPLTPCTAGSTCDDGATCGAYGTASASACAPSCLEDAAICPSGSHCQEFAP
jgi:hypothetical protein